MDSPRSQPKSAEGIVFFTFDEIGCQQRIALWWPSLYTWISSERSPGESSVFFLKRSDASRVCSSGVLLRSGLLGES